MIQKSLYREVERERSLREHARADGQSGPADVESKGTEPHGHLRRAWKRRRSVADPSTTKDRIGWQSQRTRLGATLRHEREILTGGLRRVSFHCERMTRQGRTDGQSSSRRTTRQKSHVQQSLSVTTGRIEPDSLLDAICRLGNKVSLNDESTMVD